MKKNILLVLVCLLCAFCAQKNNEKAQGIGNPEYKSIEQRAEEMAEKTPVVDSTIVLNSPESVIKDKALLWRIEGNGLTKPSYLFGCMVSKDARAFWFGNLVLKKLAECDVAVFENMDTKSLSKSQLRKIIYMDNNKDLSDILSRADYNFVENELIYKEPNKGGYFKEKPLYSVAAMYVEIDKKDKPYNVDDYLKEKAKALNKRTWQLVTIFEFNNILDKIPLKRQGEVLVNFFREYNKNVARRDSALTLCQKSDIQGIFNLSLNDEYFIASRNVVSESNKLYLKRLAGFMQQASVFCNVGVECLWGETGLLHQLKKQGYKVTPVFSQGAVADIYNYN